MRIEPSVGDGLPSGRSKFVKSLIQQFDRIAFVQHAFHEDCTVNTRHAVVSLRYFLQYCRCFFAGIGIERDHHAARIALQNRDDYFRSNPQ